MTFFLLLFAGVAYFLEAHVIALIFIAISVLEQILVIVRALLFPEWLMRRRLEANMQINFFSPGRGLLSLLAAKALLLLILVFFAYHVLTEGGLI